MTDITARDLSRDAPRFEWPSVEEFIKRSEWTDGTHTVQLDSGPSLDIILTGQPFEGSHRSVPVFFSGAVQNRETKSGPLSSVNTGSVDGGFPYILISDPSLELDATLGLAWHSGNEAQDLAGQLTSILIAFADFSDRELLLVGGSGGGYAALFYGQCLGNRASVFVWNAQTDILEYNETFVKHYLASAFPLETQGLLDSAEWKRKVRQALADAGVETSLLPGAMEGRRPRRSVFIQNATDWHVAIHTAPFVKASQYRHRGRGLHMADSNHAVWIAHYGADHLPLPAECVTSIVTDMLDPDRTASKIVSSFRASGLVPNQQPGREPRDLSHLTELIRSQLSLTVEVQQQDIVAKVSLGEVPLGYGGIRFGFFSVSPNGETSNVKWFSEDTECRIPRHKIASGSTIRVRVRDGFNVELISLAQAADTESHPPQGDKRIFIYGSCVSRDPFALSHGFEVVDYVARSPLGSAFATPPSSVGIDFDSIPSAFQRRMARTDVFKDLAALLEEASFDHLLVDLVDERLQIMPYRDAVITYSAEIQCAGITAERGDLKQIGSTDYYSRWKSGLDRLLTICPPAKIIINKVFWATKSDDGGNLPNQEYIARNNAVLRRLYDEIATTADISFIEYPPQLLVADRSHNWGPAPYHFIRDASLHLLRELESITQSEPPDLQALASQPSTG